MIIVSYYNFYCTEKGDYKNVKEISILILNIRTSFFII